MINNLNEAFFDAMVRHQIGLLRVAGGIRNKILAILDETEIDIARQIQTRLANTSGITSPATIKRLQALEKSIKTTRTAAWVKSLEVWKEELTAIAKAEPKFLQTALKTISPVELDLSLPSATLLSKIVTDRPFEGKVLREWAQDIAAADIKRIHGQIRIGMTQGESSAVIAKRVIGTALQKGRDGVTEITRRNAEAITRTAVNAISNSAKREFYMMNTDIVSQELFVATLDSRTTLTCAGNDGKKFPVGQGPIPPLHFGCRSLRVAIFGAEAIGSRPMKPFTEKEILREYNAANGTSAKTRATLPRGHKGMFDRYSSKRMRDLTGQVEAKVTYQQFLSRQTAEVQDDILGKAKGRLFRSGNLTLDKFVDAQGRELTLAQLAERHAAAFRSAGL